MSPLPRLIHPIPVTIEPLSRSTTEYDDDLREPVGETSYGAPITGLEAQNKDIDDDVPKPRGEGVVEVTKGYLLFRQIDIDGVYTPLRGDRVTRIGNRTGLDLYVTKMQYRAHYPDQGGHSLVKIWYADRGPTRQRGDL